MNLIIVESPAKAKTIARLLGKDFTVEASMGHVRDLPQKSFGVDIEHDFKPTYVAVSGRGKLIKKLKEKTVKMERVYFGTDNDREGEAISWHLSKMLGLKDGSCRITFNEITESSIRESLKKAQDISLARVNAQQARRILDRIVGYMVSPLLWRKVRKGLSAGRVQSVALRLICEREEEIKAFKPREYWTVTVKLKKQTEETLTAKLVKVSGSKAEINNEEEAKNIADDLKDKTFAVEKLEKKKKQRSPQAPFTTSSLQQEASKRFGFTASRTMRVAQQLYEGLEIEKGERVGLITYMRTDSVRISDYAQKRAADFIRDTFGKEFLPEKNRKYKSKKGAQEAHEAIRPTDPFREPEKLKTFLSYEQLKLYSMIWKRFIASQCKNAVFELTSVKIVAGKYLFHANGSVTIFQGFMKVYPDEKKQELLPPLKDGEILILVKQLPEQHFTKPPPRYSEGSLVKELEEKGIGRPSTYAPIINTIQARNYVDRENGQLFPTQLGVMVNGLLVESFDEYFNVKFTADMETQLDCIENGKLSWVKVLKDFYKPFGNSVEKAKSNMQNLKKALEEPTDELCEKCGANMVIRWGRYGRFLACTAFPHCKNAKTLVVETGFGCPKTDCSGKIIERKSKRKRTFYGCSRYPECDFIIPRKPVDVKCEKCGADFLVKKGKGNRVLLECIKEGCDYKKQGQPPFFE